MTTGIFEECWPSTGAINGVHLLIRPCCDGNLIAYGLMRKITGRWDDARITVEGSLFQPCQVSMHTEDRVSAAQLNGTE